MDNKALYDVVVRCLDYDPVGYFYRALVIKRGKQGTRVLLYNDQTEYVVNSDMVFRLRSSTSQPMIIQGDYMLCTVINEKGLECFVPGIVQSIKISSDHTKINHYLMLYFNGQYGDNVTFELVKIPKSMYGYIVDHIFQKMPIQTTLTPYVEENNETEKMNIITFINDCIANQVHKTVSKEISDGFDNLELSTKFDELTVKLDEIGSANNEQSTAINMSLEILEEMRQEKQKKVEFRRSVGKQIKSELERIRCSLPKLEENDKVLAKYADDGWYYYGTVKSVVNEHMYLVADANKFEEEISRENIVTTGQSLKGDWEPQAPVIAPHPAYSYSYAPGLVVGPFDSFNIIVRFYDGVEGTVNSDDAFYIGLCKFESDIADIIRLETELVSKVVIARNNFTGRYESGVVKEKLGNKRKYIVEFDKPIIVDDISYMIIKDEKNKNTKLEVDDCVLAKKSPEDCAYHLGSIVDKDGINLTILFHDGQIVKDLIQMTNDIYKLPKSCCQNMYKFYKSSIKTEKLEFESRP